MQTTSGSWRFDPVNEALINPGTGQTVRFAEVAGVPPPDPAPASGVPDGRFASAVKSAQYLRFYYEDRDIKAVLLVLARTRYRQWDKTTTCSWFLNHLETVVLHPRRLQRESLPYGYWRRIEDGVIDAFLCWPQTEATGVKPHFVVSNGGWFNGAWHGDVRRSYTDWRKSNPAINTSPFAPFVQPLDAQPATWQFIGADRMQLEALWAGIRERAPGHFEMDPSWTFTRLNGQMPFLRRLDGPAAMGLAGLDSEILREDYRARGYAFYADEDVFFCLGVEAFNSWSFSLKPFRVVARKRPGAGFGRRFRPPPQFFATGRVRTPRPADLDRLAGMEPSRMRESLEAFYNAEFDYPSPELARRVEIALTEGWMAWRGTVARLLDDPDKIEQMCRATNSVRIRDNQDENGRCCFV